MKITRNQFFLGAGLVLLSFVLYYAHYMMFHDVHHILIYFFGDLSFLPVEILLVSLIFHRVLENKTKRDMLKKLNMIIGVFFTETGNGLVEIFSSLAVKNNKLSEILKIKTSWKSKDFAACKKALAGADVSLELTGGDIGEIKDYLVSKRDFLLKILENPILLEHETFTDLMMSIFHLEEELCRRESFDDMSKEDLEHIRIDIKRVVSKLYMAWVLYMEHLNEDYPFLYSFAVRTNPFDPDSKVEF